MIHGAVWVMLLVAARPPKKRRTENVSYDIRRMVDNVRPLFRRRTEGESKLELCMLLFGMRKGTQAMPNLDTRSAHILCRPLIVLISASAGIWSLGHIDARFEAHEMDLSG